MHRYMIETGLADYGCDNYFIRPYECLEYISVEDDKVDHCRVFAAVTAIHDYGDELTLENFEEYRLRAEAEMVARNKNMLEAQRQALLMKPVEDQRDVQ